jgi:hypothetical protein
MPVCVSVYYASVKYSSAAPGKSGRWLFRRGRISVLRTDITVTSHESRVKETCTDMSRNSERRSETNAFDVRIESPSKRSEALDCLRLHEQNMNTHTMDLDHIEAPPSLPSLAEQLSQLSQLSHSLESRRREGMFSDCGASLASQPTNTRSSFVVVRLETCRQPSGPLPPPKRHYTTNWRAITRKAILQNKASM